MPQSRAVAALSVLFLAAASISTYAADSLTGPSGDGFYVPPPLPERERSAITWHRPLQGTMALPAAVRNHVVVYNSMDDRGRVVPVSGTVAVPPGDAPIGGWPVITWTHGTTGLAAICAPSRDTADGPEHAYIETIRTLLDGFVKRGYAVVATDYVGLGIAGFHPFLQGVPTGRNALDILRAARRLEPAIGSRYAVMGHSQGGQVDLFAASMAPRYIPEFSLVGNVAFAPGSNIASRLRTVIASGKTELSLPYVLYTLQSFATTDRAIDLRKILTPEAIRHLPDLQVQCMSHALTTGYWSTAISRDQFVAKPDVRAFLRFASRNEPGRLRIAAPTLIIQGRADVTVFPEATDEMVGELCSQDNNVAYRTFEGVDHNGSMVAGAAVAHEWLEARFAGRKALSECDTLVKDRK